MDIYDRRNPPSREGLESHQVWVWMNGPGQPHWEVRGTGVALDRATQLRAALGRIEKLDEHGIYQKREDNERPT